MPDKYDDLWLLACCINQQARRLLDEDPHLEAPTRGGITHSGEDFCCDSMWVKLQPLTVDLSATGDAASCAVSVLERFDVVLAVPACTEKEFFRDCSQDHYGVCGEDPATGCFDPVYKVGTDCDSADPPTVAEEAAYVWRARSLLRRELAKAVQCCADGDCVSVRCHSVRVSSVTTETEGGCSYITVTIDVEL